MAGRDEILMKRRDWALIIPVSGVLCILGSFGWAAMRRYFEPGSIALGTLGLLLFLAGFIRAEAANLKYYFQAALYTVFVIGFCVCLFMLIRRHDVQLDLSAQKRHTLAESTRNFLGVLKKDVEVVVFDVTREPYLLVDKLAEETPRLSWSIHDPRSDPEFTRSFGGTVPEGTIFIEHGEKRKRISVDEISESALVSGIVEVTRDQDVNIYFLEGHGELAFDLPKGDRPEEVPSLSAFKNFLASRAMNVASFNLAEQGYIPEDATLLVLAGPTRDLLDVERRAIETYLLGGGSLLVMVDLPQTSVSVDYSNLDSILRRRGIVDDEKVIADYRGEKTQGNPFMIPLVTYNAQHPIGEPMVRAAAEIQLPLVRGFARAKPAPRDFAIQPIVESSPESWTQSFTEVFVAQAQPQLKPPTSDAMAPQAIGWAVEGQGERGERLVVFGSSLLVMDGYVNVYDTAARLMLNSVNWLVKQDDLVSVPPKIIPGTPLVLTNAELQLILILIVMAFPMALLFGGTVYARLLRRN